MCGWIRVSGSTEAIAVSPSPGGRAWIWRQAVALVASWIAMRVLVRLGRALLRPFRRR